MRSASDVMDDTSADKTDLVPVKLPLQGSLLEMLLLSALVMSASLQLPIMGPVRQLTALLVLGLFLLRFNAVRPYFTKFWYIYLFPAWVALSILWAPAPSRTLGFAIPHIVEACALLYFVSFLSPAQIIKSISWAAQLIFFVFALPYFATIGSHTIPPGFSEKNWLANMMLVCLVSGLYVLFARESRIWERGLVLFSAPMSFLIILKAESATVLVLSLLSILFMVIVGGFWRLVARVKMLPALIIVSMIALVLFGVTAALFLFQNNPVEVFLGSLGKDTTLTGRTELWEHAKKLIAERPILGLGAEGFWLPYRGDAQFLLEAFHKGIYKRFSFHNSYLEIMVQLGVIGLILQVFTVYTLIGRVIMNWFRQQDIAAAFFVIYAVMVLMRSFTESDLYNPLSINKMILILGGMTFVAHRIGYVPRAYLEQRHANAEFAQNPGAAVGGPSGAQVRSK